MGENRCRRAAHDPLTADTLARGKTRAAPHTTWITAAQERTAPHCPMKGNCERRVNQVDRLIGCVASTLHFPAAFVAQCLRSPPTMCPATIQPTHNTGAGSRSAPLEFSAGSHEVFRVAVGPSSH